MRLEAALTIVLALSQAAMTTPCSAQSADPALVEAGRSYLGCLTTHIRRIDSKATEDEALDTAKAACSLSREYALNLIARTYQAGRIGYEEAAVVSQMVNAGYPDVARSIHEYKRKAKP